MISPGTSRSRSITRRGRRRLLFALLAASIGLSVPIWVPPLLAALSAFQVAELHVTGTEHIPPDEIRALAVTPDASVWDDPATWEERVRAHPMVREATARREGFNTLEIAIVERRPIALVATPELRPVSADGYVLPLDPSAESLDLPIVRGPVETEGGFVKDPGMRELILALARMDRTRSDFMSLVSEVGAADTVSSSCPAPGRMSCFCRAMSPCAPSTGYRSRSGRSRIDASHVRMRGSEAKLY